MGEFGTGEFKGRIPGPGTTKGGTDLSGYHPRAFHQMVAQNGVHSWGET